MFPKLLMLPAAYNMYYPVGYYQIHFPIKNSAQCTVQTLNIFNFKIDRRRNSEMQDTRPGIYPNGWRC